MPREITKTVYQYDELSDGAKDKALEWLAGFAFTEPSDWEAVYEQAKQAGSLIGISIDNIYFSGFSSQGDGACFTGRYSYSKDSLANIKKEFPKDEELHRITRSLQNLQRKNFYQLSATCTHRGHYNHSGCMRVETECDDLIQLLRDFADWIYERLEEEFEYQTSQEYLEESMRANGYEFDEFGNP